MSEKPLSRFHQPISVPGRRLLHHIPLNFVVKKVVGGADPNQAEIDRLVDAITAEEAKIRKARLGALTQSRKVIGK